ncbi:unnamed protein product [Alopecurus aequalis]
MEQQDQPINMTAALEALAPLLKNPRRTVIQAEAFTSMVMALLLVQLILGSFRRQTSSAWVQRGTWVTYTLSFPAIAYTLGLMQSSPVKNVMYPIWALLLLQAAGCTNAVRVYELGENQQWKGSFLTYCQYVIYTTVIFFIFDPSSRLDLKGYWSAVRNTSLSRNIETMKAPEFVPALLSSIILFTAILGRHFACLVVEFGYLDARKVCMFMDKLQANDEEFDPVSMKGYRYPVHFPKCDGYNTKYFAQLVKRHPVHFTDSDQTKAITIDQICQCEGRLLLSPDHRCKGIKDVCLAYAMYQLLRRRYYGMACAEEHLPETRDFVLKGLLRGTEDDYQRAFGIVEVELGFCHDYFFTKHAFIFEHELRFLLLFLARIGLILWVTYFVWGNTLSVKTFSAIIEVESRMGDNIVTVLVLSIIMLIELLQAASYMASDWCKVAVACRYVSGSWYQGNAFFEMLLRWLSRVTIFGYWKNRIDQCSVLSKLTAADMAGEGDLQAVKLAIVRTLRSCHGLPTHGGGSLRRNGVFAEFSWALHDRPQVEIMLVWHIATEHVNQTSSGEEGETEFSRRVSVCISRYCAYLIDSVPELLPGYFGDTMFVMRDVKKHAKSQNGLQDPEEDGSIFMTGKKLGKQLKAMEDSVDCWKILADFWTEKILYVAPSDNVKAHMERLAVGGEFLTHIWALLTHAGIHKIDREEDRNTMPSQPSQASV